MSDLDFDLNAPAAPSLTLDAAPAAPTLTLDPEADAKVVEEAIMATPVTVVDTPLSPEEQKMVQDFAEKIDLTNSQMILQYGAAREPLDSLRKQIQMKLDDAGGNWGTPPLEDDWKDMEEEAEREVIEMPF